MGPHRRHVRRHFTDRPEPRARSARIGARLGTPQGRSSSRLPAAAARQRCQRLQPHEHRRHVRAGRPRYDRRVELHLAAVRCELAGDLGVGLEVDDRPAAASSNARSSTPSTSVPSGWRHASGVSRRQRPGAPRLAGARHQRVRERRATAAAPPRPRPPARRGCAPAGHALGDLRGRRVEGDGRERGVNERAEARPRGPARRPGSRRRARPRAPSPPVVAIAPGRARRSRCEAKARARAPLLRRPPRGEPLHRSARGRASTIPRPGSWMRSWAQPVGG